MKESGFGKKNYDVTFLFLTSIYKIKNDKKKKLQTPLTMQFPISPH